MGCIAVFGLAVLVGSNASAQCRGGEALANASGTHPALFSFASAVANPANDGRVPASLGPVAIGGTADLPARSIASVCVDVALRHALPRAYDASGFTRAARALESMPQFGPNTTPDEVAAPAFGGQINVARRSVIDAGPARSDMEASQRSGLDRVTAQAIAILAAFAGNDDRLDASRICQTSAEIVRTSASIVFPTPFPREPSADEQARLAALASEIEGAFTRDVGRVQVGSGRTTTADSLNAVCGRVPTSFDSTLRTLLLAWLPEAEVNRLPLLGDDDFAGEVYRTTFASLVQGHVVAEFLDDVLRGAGRPERISFLQNHAANQISVPGPQETLTNALSETFRDVCRVAPDCNRAGTPLVISVWLGNEISASVGRHPDAQAGSELPRSAAIVLAAIARYASVVGGMSNSEVMDTVIALVESSHLSARTIAERTQASLEADALAAQQAAAAAAAAGPQDVPSREDVVAVLSPLVAEIAACGNGAHGAASVRITWAGGTGRVIGADIIGGDAMGTPVGSCIVRLVRGVQVRPFRRPSFLVTYPFRY